MYVGLKQPRGDGERYVTPARAAAKETIKDATEFETVSPNAISVSLRVSDVFCLR